MSKHKKFDSLSEFRHHIASLNPKDKDGNPIVCVAESRIHPSVLLSSRERDLIEQLYELRTYEDHPAPARWDGSDFTWNRTPEGRVFWGIVVWGTECWGVEGEENLELPKWMEEEEDVPPSPCVPEWPSDVPTSPDAGECVPMLPSPYDQAKRWPLAMIALSDKCIAGDEKYKDDGRGGERGETLPDMYDEDYSLPKMQRHLLKYLDPASSDYDEEDGFHHLIAVMWHAVNACNAVLKKEYQSVDEYMHYRETHGRASLGV